MTTMTPTGEGGGGSGTLGDGDSNAEQAPNPTAPVQHQQHPPPSPLSGCYLLVVLPEPHTAQHKDLILNRLAKGFLSWDKDSCHVDLEKELQALVTQSPEGEEARNGERLIQYATENLVTEVLIYPQSNTLLQCIRNLLASFTKHRHIIHAGYTFGGNGSWILQDGTFSLADFLDAFSEHEVQRVLRAYENSVTVDIHCAGVGDWSTFRLSKELCTRACRVRVNPDDVLTAGVPAITSFTNYIGQYLIAQTLDELMEPSDVVGNIRFSHPTLYVFPGGEGDAALFGINGFNMLVDGGFARKACFWDFARHLDRLDAVLVTRVNNSNIGGMSSILQKKKEMQVYPQIGHFFCNLIERKHLNSPDGDKDIDPLILNLIDIGQQMMLNLRHINLRPHPCYRDPEPINLYHKVGHGTLDMYVLSPNKDSREVREFMLKWNSSDSKLFAGSHKKESNNITFPVQNLVSICALLVWQPANPETTITRILFPGSTPQHKIFEGFERLRHLEFLKHTVCTAKSLSPSASLVTLKDKAAILKPKLGSIERETKRLAEIRKEKRDTSEVKAVKKDSIIDDTIVKNSTGKPVSVPQPKIETKAKKVVENKKIESESKEIKKIESESKEIKKIESESKEIKKIEKEIKETKKETKKVEKSERLESETKKTDIKVETEKTALIKENKVQKTEIKKKENKETPKPIVKTSKPDNVIKSSIKTIEKKPKFSGEKKDIMKSSPTTPKKSMNGIATKTEISKTITKSVTKTTSKIQSAPPAKSTKDANNRMVVERKNIELSSMAGSAGSIVGAKPAPKTKPAERKTISRRTKQVSPSKGRLPISPAKSTRSTPTASVKSEKDAVIRKMKGETTDSSAVSTPSGIEPESAVKLVDKNLTERSEDISLDSIESKVLADLKEEREVVEEIEAVLQKAERIEEARKDERFEGDDDITAEATDKKEEDMTEEDVTAEMDEVPKKASRKESQELTEEEEYLIVEKEEIFTEDSVQSGETEHKHHLDELESEKCRLNVDKDSGTVVCEQEEEKEFVEEKKDEIPEKKLVDPMKKKERKKSMEFAPEDREILKEEMQQIIASATEVVQKTEEKDNLAKKDSEDVIKETLTSSPDKLDSPNKPDSDQKESMPEKLEESQERISTLESGATTTAPTLPEDERIPLDDIKEDIDEKHIIEEVKEKDIPIKPKEVIQESLPVITKPDIKVLDVQPTTHRGIPRDVVKTPDEVADLPVHEEVDPKLYKLHDLEKDKNVKVPLISQQSKEPQVSPPIVKEQKDKGMFSFFGKVADKFEKSIDKLTKKTRRDSDKDAEEKSSKSSSPKEIKTQEKAVFEHIDIDKVFPKVGKVEEKIESFENAKPDIRDIKAVIKNETAEFLQEEIANTKDELLMQPTTVKELQVKEESTIKDERLDKKVKEQVIEEIEEVEAFVEEASKKFQNVKDSLQDSLESLEEKKEEKNIPMASYDDAIKDTLTGVVDKLVDIESDVNNFIETKEPEKVKFTIPPSDEMNEDEDDSEVVARDFKEAVRDVAEVLVGTAGIEIEKEEKPKNVEEIVKKVAKVLKDDDFLSEEVLSVNEKKPVHEDKSSVPVSEDIIIVKKVGVIEHVAPQQKIDEIIKDDSAGQLPLPFEKVDKVEISEEPRIDSVSKTDVSKSKISESSDDEDIKRLCEEIMKDDDVCIRPTVLVKNDAKEDVMDLGLEKICIKKVAYQDIYDENIEDDRIIVEPKINIQQSLSPGRAEIVTVTPGSTPSSPKLVRELELSELPAEYKDIFTKEMNLEDIIEEFIVVRRQKVTMQILEYIANVKCVPKEKVINIIQEMIIKYEIPRENVTDSIQILRARDDISFEKRLEVENYITKEFLNENKKISLMVIEEISKKYLISKPIVIDIVEDVMIKRKLSRKSVFDISQDAYFVILKSGLEKTEEEETKEEKDFLPDASSTTKVEDSQFNLTKKDKRDSLSTKLKEIDEDKMIDGFVSISSTDTVEAFLRQERKQSQDETKVLNDFEAVEQEYKVRDIPSVSDKQISNEEEDKEIEESFDDFNEVIEADEKFVKETIEKIGEEEDTKEVVFEKVKQRASREFEASELLDIDTKEKYLDEAKEKVTNVKDSVTFDSQPLTSRSETSDESRSFEKGGKELDTDYSKTQKKLKELEDELIFEKPAENATQFGKSIGDEKRRDSVYEYEKKLSDAGVNPEDSTQESHETIVKRMVVTASSEDGGHEIEICPTGTIKFSKTSSPEESVKSDDDRLIPGKDSSVDKDSLQSEHSVSEKDSIASEKLDQDDEKVSSEDSLDKASLEKASAKVSAGEIKQVDTKITDAVPSETIKKFSITSSEVAESIPDSVYSKDVSPTESMFSTSSIPQVPTHSIESSHIIQREELIYTPTAPEEPTDDENTDDEKENYSKLPSFDKVIDDKESNIAKSFNADFSEHISDKISTIQKEETSKSLNILDGNKDKLTSPDKLFDSSELRYDASKTVLQQFDDEYEPSIVKEDKNIEKVIRKESIISIDNVQTASETVSKSRDESKSPSLEKEFEKNKVTDELSTVDDKKHIIEFKNIEDDVIDKSKLLNIEKEIDEKQKSSDNIIFSEDSKCKLDSKIFDLTDDKIIKENFEYESDLRESTSKNIVNLETAKHLTEKHISDNVTKDMDVEKMLDEKLITSVESVEKEPENQKSLPVKDRLLSTKEIDQFEPLKTEEKLSNNETSTKIVDEFFDSHSINKFDLSSFEKDVKTSPTKSITTIDKEVSDKIIIDKSQDKSKSPSPEKEISDKDVSSEKLSDIADSKTNDVLDSDVKDKSKSPSAERDLISSRKMSTDITLSKTEVPIIDDHSKLPVFENEENKVDISSEKSMIDENNKISGSTDFKTSSVSVEKEIVCKDISPRKSVEIDNVNYEAHESSICRTEDKSKSPSLEREIRSKRSSSIVSEAEDKEPLFEYPILSKDKDPSAKEAFVCKKDEQSKSSIFEKEPVMKGDISKDATTIGHDKLETEKTTIDKMKVEDDERDLNRKSSIVEHEQIITNNIISGESKSRSPSLDKEMIRKDSSTSTLFLSTNTDFEEDKQNQMDKLGDKSKSPNDKRESDKKDITDDKSALLEFDKDKIHSEITCTSKITTEITRDKGDSFNINDQKRSSSIVDVDDVLIREKSISYSDEKSKAAKEDDEKTHLDNIENETRDIMDFKNGKPCDNVESTTQDIRKSSMDLNGKSKPLSKSSSPEKILDSFAEFSDLPTDYRKSSINSCKLDDASTDKSRSPSIVSEKPNEQDISGRPKSSSLIDDKFDIESIDNRVLKDNDLEKSTEKSPINSRSSSISDSKIRSNTLMHEYSHERKASMTSNESSADSKGKDRSRSQSLFETGDKTPLVRSRAASLYEDKLAEKLGISEYGKDSIAYSDISFQEKDELQLSQEMLNQETEEPEQYRMQSSELLDEESPSRRISVTDKSLRDTIQILKNISPTSEPESLITCKSDRSEPHIDEEITISENKRIEVETLLMDDYITRGIKINEPILDQIIIKTSLPKYIINEIIEEIAIKKHMSRDSITDQSIYQEDDYDDAHLRSDSDRKVTPEISEPKSSGFSTPDSQRYEDKEEKNVSYSDYESPFHKAFMGGMTEIRTTHITTLSGKSTPDFVPRDGTPDSSSEITSAKVTTIKNVPEHFDKPIDDKPIHSQIASSSVDEKPEKVLKSDDKFQEECFKDDVLITTEINKSSEDEKHINVECDKANSTIEKTSLEKDVREKEILEKKEAIKKEESETVYEQIKHEIFQEIEVPSIIRPESAHDDDINKTNIEIITTTTTKTIITKKELDSVSRINTLSTDNTLVDKKLISEVQDDKSALKSTSTNNVTNIEEKLISLESKESDIVTKEEIIFTGKDLMDHTIPEQLEQSVSPLIGDLIGEDKSCSGKSSTDIFVPKDISDQDYTTKSSVDSGVTPIIRDGSIIQPHFSGRSTPDKKSDGRSRTATPEGFRSGDVIRTIVTTTRTMSDDGEIITTTQEVTEATNDKGETILLNEKTDVKVDERLPENLINDVKPIDIQRKFSISSDTADPMNLQSSLSSDDNKLGTQFSETHQSHSYLPEKHESVKIADDFSSAAMSSSFYSETPPESIKYSHTHTVTEKTEFIPEQDDFAFKKFTVEKEYAGGYKDKDSKKYVDEADLDFEKALRDVKSDKDIRKDSKESSVLGACTFTVEHSSSVENTGSDTESKEDPLADWGSPLGLPSPKPPRKFNLRSPMQPCSSADLSPDSLNFDIINDWGEPLKLPSPAPAANEISNKAAPGTPKKEKKQIRKIISENIKNKKRSESPLKIEKKIKDTKNKIQPIYVDLTYVSHHGNSFYTALEFFKKVRARYYVFSGTEPSRQVYDALLEAKKSWEDKDLEVTMIPTYDTDTLGYWVADNEEALATYHIDLSPSASRCTINLQDHETSCSAYRLEF